MADYYYHFVVQPALQVVDTECDSHFVYPETGGNVERIVALIRAASMKPMPSFFGTSCACRHLRFMRRMKLAG